MKRFSPLLLAAMLFSFVVVPSPLTSSPVEAGKKAKKTKKVKKDLDYYLNFECKEKKKKRKEASKLSGKAKANDPPDWAKSFWPCADPKESSDDFAVRVIVQHYYYEYSKTGEPLTSLDDQRLKKGPDLARNKIKKWAERSFER